MHNHGDIEKTFVERLPDNLAPAASHTDSESVGGNHSVLSGTPQTAARPTVGETRLGPNLITEIVGVGGMATVYKVWNERLEVFRAVKMLSQEACSARFETEAKIVAKLRHKGIVEIYNIGEWNGMPYMEMEFVDGSDLQEILAKRGIIPEIASIAIATIIADALAHAHSKTFTLVGKQYNGIIHRDLKPANILISNHGAVKLTDFGIARPTQTSLHTIVDGSIAGTLHYLAPEQMGGGEVDNRSDIYAFGTILYEMAFGEKTFPQESVVELMKQKSLNKFKMPSEHNVSINTSFAKIMLRCLKSEPAKRYQSAKDLAADLQKLKDSLTTQTSEEILESYFSGTGDIAYKDTGKTQWLLNKLKTPITFGKTKITEQADKQPTEEPESSAKPKTLIMPDVSKTSTTPETSNTSNNMKVRPSLPKNTKRIIFIASLTLLAILSLSYIITRIAATKPAKNTSVGETVISDSTVLADTGAAPSETPSVSKTATEPEKTLLPPSKIAATELVPAKTNVPPVAAPKPKSEIEYLREAITAGNAKQWNLAIEILEKDGIYKAMDAQRTLHLFNAYVEAQRFSKAQTLMEATSLKQDAYFLFCAGKYWHYRGSPNKAIEYFEAALTRKSIVETISILPDAALYFIADIKHERFRAAQTAANKSAALEAWHKAYMALSSKSNDPRTKRAEREIGVLSLE